MLSESGDNAGLYLGGTGRYIEDILDPNYIIPWASTEHNINTWHTLYLAGKVLGNSSYTNAAETLKQAIVSKLWNPSLHRFNQGYEDTADALDINSWGAIFLNAVGEYDKARTRCRMQIILTLQSMTPMAIPYFYPTEAIRAQPIRSGSRAHMEWRCHHSS
jgi:hypothetical protein